MRCPACAHENAPASKFCGVCGHRLADGPPTVPPGGAPAVVTAPPPPDLSAAMAGTAPIPIARRDAGATGASGGSLGGSLGGGSLGGSLRLPEAQGARIARFALVLAVDAALVVGGVVLLTRKPSPRAVTSAAVTPAPGPGTGSGSGSGSGSGPTPGPSNPVGPVAPGRDPGRDPGRVLPSGGQDAGTVPGDARSAAVVDAAGGLVVADAAPAVAIDAAEPAPVAIDAAEPAPVMIDAAEPTPVAIDAAEPTPVAIDAPEAAVSADAIVRELNHLLVAASGRLDRCYQNATKSLPPEQALRGQVDIGLAVMPTGAVSGVSILQNTTGSEQLGQCVQGIVAGWSFSPHDGNEPLHFARPFKFGPS